MKILMLHFKIGLCRIGSVVMALLRLIASVDLRSFTDL